VSTRHEIGIRAVKSAASIIRDGAGHLRSVHVQKKAPGDLVTEIDKAAEQEIRRVIWAAFPGDSILGEEGGAQPGPSGTPSGWQWIVDPLDGTFNFVHGNPHVCTSIACLDPTGWIDIAIVKDPFRVEVFHAQRGKGAFSGDVPLSINRRTELSESLVAMVLPSAQSPVFETVWPRFEAVTRGAGQIRRTGSAVLDMAYVAAGRLDAFVVMNLRKWDIAGGALLVQEAGGTVTDLAGGTEFLAHEQAIAGNAELVTQLVERIQSVR
jgi:myo-inositol-1(or 4)-monophosphatase